MSRLLQALRSRVTAVPADSGMSTAEYCVGVIAVCAFAVLLYHVLQGSVGQGLIDGFLGRALEFIKI